MFSGVDLKGFEVGKIENESMGTNRRPQAVAAADRNKGYLVDRCGFYLAVITSVPEIGLRRGIGLTVVTASSSFATCIIAPGTSRSISDQRSNASWNSLLDVSVSTRASWERLPPSSETNWRVAILDSWKLVGCLWRCSVNTVVVREIRYLQDLDRFRSCFALAGGVEAWRVGQKRKCNVLKLVYFRFFNTYLTDHMRLSGMQLVWHCRVTFSSAKS